MNPDIERAVEIRKLIYEQFSLICKALGNARRFEIMDLLAFGEHTVEALAQETGMSVANTSQHLQQLRAARLVFVRRQGNEMRYSLVDEAVFAMLRDVQKLAEKNLADVDRIVYQLEKERQDLKIISFEDLYARLGDESLVLLDVRPVSEYQFGHIPGAKSLILNKLKKRRFEPAQGKELVVYCRSYYSSLSDYAVRRLMGRGCVVYRLEKGINEWRDEGYPIEKKPQR